MNDLLVEKLAHARCELSKVLEKRKIKEPTSGDLWDKWEKSVDMRGKELFADDHTPYTDPDLPIALAFARAANELATKWDGLGRKVVRKLANKVSDDLMSEAQVALIQASRKFEPERGIQFKTVAYKYLHSRILNYFRSIRNYESRRTSVKDIANLEHIKPIWYTDEYDWLRVIIDQLSKRDSEVIYLYFFKRMTLAKIGVMLGISKQAVGHRLDNAKHHLHKLLRKHRAELLSKPVA